MCQNIYLICTDFLARTGFIASLITETGAITRENLRERIRESARHRLFKKNANTF